MPGEEEVMLAEKKRRCKLKIALSQTSQNQCNRNRGKEQSGGCGSAAFSKVARTNWNICDKAHPYS